MNQTSPMTYHGQPIGTEFITIVPLHISYAEPDVEVPEYEYTRRALACEWYPPIKRDKEEQEREFEAWSLETFGEVF
jgi:hypothetical protein